MFVFVCCTPGLGAEKLAEPESAGSLHAQPWAFGQSGNRNDAIWKDGVDGATISKKAKKGRASTDTAKGINQALKESEKSKSHIGMSMNDENGVWKVTPDGKRSQPDEAMYRNRRHVVRAFADVKASDDLSISVGPELILKDERHADESASESEPDSSVGVGMRFQYDF